MYKFYIGGELLPVTPGAVTLKTNNKDETVDLINGGTYTILNPPGLSEWEFEFMLPSTKVPFAQYENGFKAPQYYVNHLEDLKTTNEPFRFIIVRNARRGVDNLNAYEDTNMEVSLGEFSVVEDVDEYGFGKHVKISLKQYKRYETERYSISGSETTIDDSIPRYAIVKDGTYISREGDTFLSIAFSQMRDEKYAEALAIYNELEFTLDPLPEFTILQIDVDEIKKIYEGNTVSPNDVDIWDPTTYINGIKDGTIGDSEYGLYITMTERVAEPSIVKRSIWDQLWGGITSFNPFTNAGRNAFINSIAELFGSGYPAPFEDQPGLIQLGWMLEAMMSMYVTLQEEDHTQSLNGIEKDIETVQQQLESVENNITELNEQINSMDASDPALSSLLALQARYLDDKTELQNELTDLLNRYNRMESLSSNGPEFVLDDNTMNNLTTALNNVKNNTVASTTLTTWCYEIGLLEG